MRLELLETSGTQASIGDRIPVEVTPSGVSMGKGAGCGAKTSSQNVRTEHALLTEADDTVFIEPSGDDRWVYVNGVQVTTRQAIRVCLLYTSPSPRDPL